MIIFLKCASTCMQRGLGSKSVVKCFKYWTAMSGVRCDCWNCHYQWANYVLDPGPCFEFFFEGAHQFFLSTREILKIQFDQKWWVKSQRQKMLLFNLVILLYIIYLSCYHGISKQFN